MLSESLVRSIKCDGNEIDLSLLATCAYIEFMSLEGAQLMVEFNDIESIIRDDYAVRAGVTLEVEFNDFSNDSFTEEFQVLANDPARAGFIMVSAMQSQVAAAKVPAKRSRFFVDKTVEDIVKALMPKVASWDIENINGVYTYHLLQNMTPSKLIRKIERDLDISVYVLRGVGYIKACKSIDTETHNVTLEYNNPAAAYPISALSPFDLSKLWAREVGKAYFSWSMVGGVISNDSADGVPVFVSHRTVPQLKNLTKQFMPALNLNCFGSLQMSPSQKVEMIFHRHDNESVIDESLPDTATITRITHFQTGLNYSCNLEVSTYEQF
jgi:hypothetical protein